MRKHSETSGTSKMWHNILAAAIGIAASIIFFAASVFAAKADGMTVTPAIYASRPFTCYLKAYGSGEFVQHNVNMATVSIDGLGANSYGFTGQIGCDLSSDKFLVGVFADYTWYKANVNITAGVPVLSIPTSNESSIGARVGVWANSATLLYGLAAYTVAQEKGTMSGLSLGLSGPKGATIGGGIEVNLGKNILATLEYRHTAFDTTTTTLVPMIFDTTENTVRAGIGYRF